MQNGVSNQGYCDEALLSHCCQVDNSCPQSFNSLAFSILITKESCNPNIPDLLMIQRAIE